jgi:hypothetical protein
VNKYRFEKIKENLINEYGKEGASTESVLAETC